MPIYIKYDSIKGEVTAEGHQNWVECGSLQFGVGRAISTPVGRAASRESSSPSISEITLSKLLDKSSPHFFAEATYGQAKPTVTIDLVEVGSDKQDTYLTFTLTNAMVSSYSLSSGGDRPSESLSINFTKIEIKYTPYDDKHKPGSPIPAGYDLALGKKV